MFLLDTPTCINDTQLFVSSALTQTQAGHLSHCSIVPASDLIEILVLNCHTVNQL